MALAYCSLIPARRTYLQSRSALQRSMTSEQDGGGISVRAHVGSRMRLTASQRALPSAHWQKSKSPVRCCRTIRKKSYKSALIALALHLPVIISHSVEAIQVDSCV